VNNDQLYQNHAFITEDEEVWETFCGEVPRPGEKVNFLDRAGNDYIVESVRWFCETILVVPNNPLCGDKTISSARVLLKEVPNG